MNKPLKKVFEVREIGHALRDGLHDEHSSSVSGGWDSERRQLYIHDELCLDEEETLPVDVFQRALENESNRFQLREAFVRTLQEVSVDVFACLQLPEFFRQNAVLFAEGSLTVLLKTRTNVKTIYARKKTLWDEFVRRYPYLEGKTNAEDFKELGQRNLERFLYELKEALGGIDRARGSAVRKRKQSHTAGIRELCRFIKQAREIPFTDFRRDPEYKIYEDLQYGLSVPVDVGGRIVLMSPHLPESPDIQQELRHLIHSVKSAQELADILAEKDFEQEDRDVLESQVWVMDLDNVPNGQFKKIK